jgi:hypothetical protein
MFWEEADLKELEGTDITCKLVLLKAKSNTKFAR